ncbi:nuclear transport factor 2 family protein [Desulfobacula sp.]|uniref:YybH family protein n=1 Tax=Desulfobacula sp. TaxID=2593537 RepID=UPI002617A952|nr:nuclear transport factor 2 family protein [Desulfobacula sp.]
MKLARKEIKRQLIEWNLAWERHDLDKVMALFHDDIFFENWTGAYIKGKKALKNAWENWFNNHGNFRFLEEEIFIDEHLQKVLYRWVLEWPSTEPGFEDKLEIRKGVDVIHFQDGKIINKLTYTKTAVEIDDKRLLLHL